MFSVAQACDQLQFKVKLRAAEQALALRNAAANKNITKNASEP